MQNFIELRDMWEADARRARAFAEGHLGSRRESLWQLSKAATLENCAELLTLVINAEEAKR